MKYYLTLFALLISIGLWAQAPVSRKQLDKKQSALYKKALKASRNGKYKDSNKHLKKLLKKTPQFVDGKLLAAANAYNQKEYDTSLKIFDAVIKQYPDYNPMVYYSLATVQSKTEDYANAAKNYAKFARLLPEHKNSKKALKMSKTMAFRAKALANPVPFEPMRLNDNINTNNHEYIAMPSVDGESIVFTRRINNQEDFYIAHIEDEEVTEVIPILDLNTPYNEGVHTVSADGKTMIFTACDRKKEHSGCDLFYSEWKDGKWSKELSMGHVINTSAWDAQPSLSADGKVLIFSSNRKGSKGKDLWISAKSDRGWTLPQRLSDVINTDGDEESPFLHPDGQTLYFRSTGHLGMGDFDMFLSRYDASNNTWSTPQNLGYPINTKGNEGAFSVSLDGKTAYFASDRAHEGKKQKNLDIYKFNLYKGARPQPTTFVKIKVTDMDGMPLDCNYTTQNISKNVIADKGYTSDGIIITALPSNNNYATIIEKEGYIYHSENFNLSGINTALEPYVLTIKLEPMAIQPKEVVTHKPIKSQPVIMKNIFFDTGSAHLKIASDFEINTLFTLLNNDANISVEIIGHTDNTGSDAINDKLSLDRANAIKNRLISLGISSRRLITIGKGSHQPIADNDTEEGRQLNRRTEFVIVR